MIGLDDFDKLKLWVISVASLISIGSACLGWVLREIRTLADENLRGRKHSQSVRLRFLDKGKRMDSPQTWQRRENSYKAHIAELDDTELLRDARLRWFEYLQREPRWREDTIYLAACAQECMKRGLTADFEAYEALMREELRKQGRLPVP